RGGNERRGPRDTPPAAMPAPMPGGGAVAAPAAPAAPSPFTPPRTGTRVGVEMQAETDASWRVMEDATIDVIMARETILEMAREVVAGTAVEVDAELPITLHLMPAINAEIIGEALRQVALPAPQQPVRTKFLARAKAAGRVRVDVELWQNRMRLGGIQLNTRAVAAGIPPVAAPPVVASGTVAPSGARRAPVDVLRVSEDPSQPPAGTSIRYDISFDAIVRPPEARGQGYSPQLTRERRAYMDGIYTRIQDRWEDSARDAAAFADDLRAIGLDLWNAIVPEKVQALLWERRDSLDVLQVLTTEAYVPWELVFINEPGRRTAHKDGRFLGELGMVRWVYGSEGTGFAPMSLRWGRMKVVQPDYAIAGDVLPAAKAEADFLVQRYGAERVAAEAKAIHDLVKARGSGTWDVLHYCGHGEAEAASIEGASLRLQTTIVDGAPKDQRLYADTIRTTAELREPDDVESPGHIVLLNACQAGRSGELLSGFGGFAQAFVQGGAGLFVAPLWSVGDQLASTFVEAFYASLAGGRSVAEATRDARTAARDAGDATWLAYAVYGEPTARIAMGT
nr:CHAT domain-containing protein [Gemmatimonadaceae bacterium]